MITIVIAGCGGVGSTMPNAPKIQTTTNLIASPTVITLGGTVTLNASVTYPPAETATGLVSFSDGSVSLGNATLDSKGIASLKLSTLATGAHSIVARFAGNGTITASISRPVVVTVLTPSMTSLNR